MASVTKKRKASKRRKSPPIVTPPEQATAQLPVKPIYAGPKAMIWEYSYPGVDELESGYLITVGDIDHPIATVFDEDDNGMRVLTKRALRAARRIANNPMAKDFGSLAVDLREYGGSDSTHEMPGWIYAMQCRPLGNGQSNARSGKS